MLDELREAHLRGLANAGDSTPSEDDALAGCQDAVTRAQRKQAAEVAVGVMLGEAISCSQACSSTLILQIRVNLQDSLFASCCICLPASQSVRWLQWHPRVFCAVVHGGYSVRLLA